ncbi:MAG TPA: O-methyltransferase [Candidatus Dormibacteraeota bacterium]|nr:O-methyltransferase [Candidatus Dormibacteraeota bacterium]
MAKTDRTWSPDSTDLDWIEATGRPPHPILVEMEAAAEPDRIPILSRDSGRLLAVLAADRRRVVEVGTAIGYSTLWMGLALPVGGSIVTIDPDRERTDRARAFWRRAGLPDERIKVVNEPALEAFAGDTPDLRGPFDLVFIDALKDEYLAYLVALMDRLAPGALVVADNVLWSGRTSGSRPARPGDGTDALREFCARVSADPAFESTILPIGDGLLVATLRP